MKEETVKHIVEDLLEKDPRCREDDKWLTYKVFQIIAHKHGEAIFIPFDLFSAFPAFETVKRTRAKIQNEERRFLPEGEVDPILVSQEINIIVDEGRPLYANSYLS